MFFYYLYQDIKYSCVNYFRGKFFLLKKNFFLDYVCFSDIKKHINNDFLIFLNGFRKFILNYKNYFFIKETVFKPMLVIILTKIQNFGMLFLCFIVTLAMSKIFSFFFLKFVFFSIISFNYSTKKGWYIYSGFYVSFSLFFLSFLENDLYFFLLYLFFIYFFRAIFDYFIDYCFLFFSFIYFLIFNFLKTKIKNSNL